MKFYRFWIPSSYCPGPIYAPETKYTRDLKSKIWHKLPRMLALGLKRSLRKVKIGMLHSQRCATHSLVPTAIFAQNLFRALGSNYTWDLTYTNWHWPPRMLGLGLRYSLRKLQIGMLHSQKFQVHSLVPSYPFVSQNPFLPRYIRNFWGKIWYKPSENLGLVSKLSLRIVRLDFSQGTSWD